MSVRPGRSSREQGRELGLEYAELDVRIYKILTYQGAKATSFTVRWAVAGCPWPFRTFALADSFRSDLVQAARRGEAFVIESGLPISMDRAARQINWLVFSREYAAMKWPQLAPNSRRNTAGALTNTTLALITGDRRRPEEKALRAALNGWAFNIRTSGAGEPSDAVALSLAWLERNTRDVGDIADPAVARAVLDALAVTADGSAAAPGTTQRQRGVLVNAIEYAVERRLLAKNPITGLSRRAPRTSRPSTDAWS